MAIDRCWLLSSCVVYMTSPSYAYYFLCNFFSLLHCMLSISRVLPPKPGPHALILGPGKQPHQDPPLPEQAGFLPQQVSGLPCLHFRLCINCLLPSTSATSSAPPSPGKASNTGRPAYFPLLYTWFASFPLCLCSCFSSPLVESLLLYCLPWKL